MPLEQVLRLYFRCHLLEQAAAFVFAVVALQSLLTPVRFFGELPGLRERSPETLCVICRFLDSILLARVFVLQLLF